MTNKRFYETKPNLGKMGNLVKPARRPQAGSWSRYDYRRGQGLLCNPRLLETPVVPPQPCTAGLQAEVLETMPLRLAANTPRRGRTRAHATARADRIRRQRITSWDAQTRPSPGVPLAHGRRTTRAARMAQPTYRQLLEAILQEDQQIARLETQVVRLQVVIDRKVFGGNRTPAGARAQEVLGSVLATCGQNAVKALAFLSRLIRLPTPIT